MTRIIIGLSLSVLLACSAVAHAVCRVVAPSQPGAEYNVIPAGEQPVLVRVWPGNSYLQPPTPARETMIVGARFLEVSGPFGLVVPVPSSPLVQVTAATIFDDVSRSAGPLVVETVVEVPDASMGYQCHDPSFSSQNGQTQTRNAGEDYGGGCGASVPMGTGIQGGRDVVDSSSDGGPGAITADAGDSGTKPWLTGHSVLGGYEVAIIEGGFDGEFTGWLKANGYGLDDESETILREYAAAGWAFVAVRVANVPQYQGKAFLEPLAITFDTPSTGPVIPALISWHAGGQISFSVWTIGDTAYEIPGASTMRFAGVPASGTGGVWVWASYGTILTGFDYKPAGKPPLGATLAPLPLDYRLQEEVHEEVIHYVPLPCPNGSSGGSNSSILGSACSAGGGSRSGGPPVDLTWWLVALAVAWVAGRRPASSAGI
ncbi:MAG: DUF2330 domain-containing protein [Myxococcota bacterium]